MIWSLVGLGASLGIDWAVSKYIDRSREKKLARSMIGGQYGAIKGLPRDVQYLVKVFIDAIREDFEYPAYVVEGRRSAARQRDLYAQGRTSEGPVVTWTRVSKHQAGLAFDLGFKGRAAADVPADWWEDVGEAWQSIGGTWGGSWAAGDLNHFEIG